MARPIKWRKIENIPTVPYFVPSDMAVAEIPKNILKLEELEAIRLKDLEGLEQGECAAKMEVSRPTCGSMKVASGQDCQGKFCRKNCWKRRRIDE